MASITYAGGQDSGFGQLDALVAETAVSGADLAEAEFLPVLDPARASAVASPCETRERVVRLCILGGHFG